MTEAHASGGGAPAADRPGAGPTARATRVTQYRTKVMVAGVALGTLMLVGFGLFVGGVVTGTSDRSLALTELVVGTSLQIGGIIGLRWARSEYDAAQRALEDSYVRSGRRIGPDEVVGYCPGCRRALGPQDRFCRWCGRSV